MYHTHPPDHKLPCFFSINILLYIQFVSVYYPLAQLRWRRGYSIWFVRPPVRPSVRPSIRPSVMTYCSCAPRIQFVQKSSFIEVKT